MSASATRRNTAPITLKYGGSLSPRDGANGSRQQSSRSFGTPLLYFVGGALILFQLMLYMGSGGSKEPSSKVGKVPYGSNKNFRGSTPMGVPAHHSSSSSNSQDRNEDLSFDDGATDDILDVDGAFDNMSSLDGLDVGMTSGDADREEEDIDLDLDDDYEVSSDADEENLSSIDVR